MNKTVTIAIGSDHAGYYIKEHLIGFLQKEGYLFKDFGAYSDEPADYPDYAHPVAFAVERGDFTYGIMICGTGNGVNMVVNKHQGIRSGLCWNKEIADLVRRHNNANICTLPGRFVSKDESVEIVDTFLKTDFEAGRHLDRVNKIALKDKLENQ